MDSGLKPGGEAGRGRGFVSAAGFEISVGRRTVNPDVPEADQWAGMETIRQHGIAREFRLGLIAVGAMVWAYGAQTSLFPPDAPNGRTAIAASESRPQEALLLQKIALLEHYLGSKIIARAEEGDNQEAKDLVATARGLLERARAALSEEKLQQASAMLDDALRNVSKAASLATRTSSVEADFRAKEQYPTLRRHVQSYLRHLSENLTPAGAGSDDQALARVEKLVADAEQLAQSGRYREANKLLSEAYRLAVVVVAERRRGQTVVSRLSFETPQDELDYERRRNDSYVMLIDIMLAERQYGQDALRAVAERHIDESRALRREADAHAKTGDYGAAIRTMEMATGRLIGVLRAGGLPVPAQ